MSDAEEFVPELGQLAFGQPFKQFACRPHVEAAFSLIQGELDRIMENALQKGYASPFSNTGNSFSCAAFEVQAYSWSEEEQPWNFKWGDVEISWYKAMGRGMSSNVEITPDKAAAMLENCLAELTGLEDEERRYDPSFASDFEKAVQAAGGWGVVAPPRPTENSEDSKD